MNTNTNTKTESTAIEAVEVVNAKEDREDQHQEQKQSQEQEQQKPQEQMNSSIEEEDKDTTNTDTAPITVAVATPVSAVSESENESDSTATTTATAATVSTSDHESSSSDSATASTEQEDHEEQTEKEEEANDVSEVRAAIAKGLSEISSRERIQIEEEVHGVKPMGLSLEEESKPLVRAHFLTQFQDIIDGVLASALPDNTPSALSPLSPYPTAAYEVCLRKNFTYATNESGELRLMCLRAELWDPAKACQRFFKHLAALYKYYGEDGLKQPLTIDQLDYEERNRSIVSSKGQGLASEKTGKRSSAESRGVYKKGKGGSKRKGSLDSLPDMLALKSGSIQVLPSRDRSGRRVVVLQAVPSVATSQQTQLQVQHSKFKAIFYFLCALLRRDVDAQRKGFVLILNPIKTDEVLNEDEYDANLLHQYKELCQSIPIRFSALHCAFDKDTKNSIPHKICTSILQSYIDNNPKMNIARIYLYDHGVSKDGTKNKLAPFGIPTHQIPVTHTGTIKLKEHNGWVKIQEWYDKKCTMEQLGHSNFNVVECPGTNDVLFSQGGKYWNGVNRFQRGNLEFMEFLESKIDIYQSTLSWKKKHSILAEVVREFANAPQSTGRPPRFLETATQIEGVAAPDGCWVELPLTSPLLMQKIRQTLLNHIRRLESSGKRKPPPSKATRVKNKGTKKKVAQNKKNKKELKVQSANKKRKIVHDSTSSTSSPSHSPHSVMKNNKLAIATFGSSITSSFHSSSNTDNESHVHKQTICEFLANAERIAVSTVAVDIACENCTSPKDSDSDSDHHENNLHDSIANDEKLVQAIIANDDRLNKEVGELFEMDSFLRDDDGDDGEHDEIADCLMGCML